MLALADITANRPWGLTRLRETSDAWPPPRHRALRDMLRASHLERIGRSKSGWRCDGGQDVFGERLASRRLQNFKRAIALDSWDIAVSRSTW